MKNYLTSFTDDQLPISNVPQSAQGILHKLTIATCLHFTVVDTVPYASDTVLFCNTLRSI